MNICYLIILLININNKEEMTEIAREIDDIESEEQKLEEYFREIEQILNSYSFCDEQQFSDSEKELIASEDIQEIYEQAQIYIRNKETENKGYEVLKIVALSRNLKAAQICARHIPGLRMQEFSKKCADILQLAYDIANYYYEQKKYSQTEKYLKIIFDAGINRFTENAKQLFLKNKIQEIFDIFSEMEVCFDDKDMKTIETNDQEKLYQLGEKYLLDAIIYDKYTDENINNIKKGFSLLCTAMSFDTDSDIQKNSIQTINEFILLLENSEFKKHFSDIIEKIKNTKIPEFIEKLTNQPIIQNTYTDENEAEFRVDFDGAKLYRPTAQRLTENEKDKRAIEETEETNKREDTNERKDSTEVEDSSEEEDMDQTEAAKRFLNLL